MCRKLVDTVIANKSDQVALNQIYVELNFKKKVITLSIPFLKPSAPKPITINKYIYRINKLPE